jgi:hypothetical protein
MAHLRNATYEHFKRLGAPSLMLDEMENRTLVQWWEKSTSGYCMKWALQKLCQVVLTQGQRLKLGQLSCVQYEELIHWQTVCTMGVGHSDQDHQRWRDSRRHHDWAEAKGLRELLSNPFLIELK